MKSPLITAPPSSPLMPIEELSSSLEDSGFSLEEIARITQNTSDVFFNTLGPSSSSDLFPYLKEEEKPFSLERITITPTGFSSQASKQKIQ